jgi:hypothetical protein
LRLPAASVVCPPPEIAPDEASHEDSPLRLHEDTLTLVLLALGDALMGRALTRSLGLPDSAARDRAEQLLVSSLHRSAEVQPT